ncbi:MAG: aminodeoxychorismate synthase [Anaerolineae bacterium]|jgi:para-aminobenzoate synthetase|nr:aminodeoxychorismate synthase [Anaerolineae bacterium]MBT4311195.1 aminodeoxychorismate synthase [Anaerolineae bacterium]MBT4458163.1 aminodeoxychorismate synthase [Anaerolineae bacterium]MBT6061807.1 aminodeoxychorismate synthase [Anaerolineae bacterium]MBT6323582.1 aminodeoxychorismate synthase [Anaerolineae bacterium]
MKTLLIDNYDSYTFNLFQLLAEVNGEQPLVIRNDQLSWDELNTLNVDNIVISPGPGKPNVQRDFGICDRVLRESNLPVLGVCLGHQGLGYAFGGEIAPAPKVMHGLLSPIRHNNGILFEGIPQHFSAVRYHSLVVVEPLPDLLEAIAWADDGVIMALRHRERPLFGVQFHPESVSTVHGKKLIENFAEFTAKFQADAPKAEASPKSGAYRVLSVIPSRKDDEISHAKKKFFVRSRKLNQLYNPEQVFNHLYKNEEFSFWLDSSRVEEGLSRFSFMGASGGELGAVVQYQAQEKKLRVIKNGKSVEREESIFDYLDAELSKREVLSPELPFDFNTGFVGYLGYELKAELGASAKYQADLPDANFIFADRLIAFDHAENATYLVQLFAEGNTEVSEKWFDSIEKELEELPVLPPLKSSYEKASAPLKFQLHRSHADYLKDIQECKTYLRDGESYEICLTTQISTDTNLEPFALYRHLRHGNPAPYSAYFCFGEYAILSSSPERFLRVDRERWVEAKPIKGTAKRGLTKEEDERLCEELRTSEKNRAENLMIVDLLRNDLGLVCEIGSVHVPKLMQIESYSTVHQMVTTIRGHLRDDMRIIDSIKAAFPGGSMTGAPKLRTMEIIDRLEQEARGVYSGVIGFLGLNGTADLNIVIRTIISTAQGMSIGAGGAVTILSDEEEEYEEMLLKSDALIKAIVTAAYGEFDEKLYDIEQD